MIFGSSEKYAIYIDPSRCMGCRSCEIACAVEHSRSKQLFSAIFEDPKPMRRIRVVVAEFFNVPMRCQHCEDAPCMRVCPVNAIERTEEGFVVLREEACIGCLMCVLACPFGHPGFSKELRVAVKCDSCVERVREGKVPACVEACPTGALKFGTVEEVTEQIRKERAAELVSGQRVPGMVYVKPVSPERKRETVGPTDLYAMYSGAR